MILPAFIITLLFNYLPMYGIQIAFRKFTIGTPILKGEWVGLRYFISFFDNYYCWRIIKNTIVLGSLSFAIGFPAPIILALMFNEIGNARFKKLTQTVSYFPFFLSTVILVGMLKNFTSYSGFINVILRNNGFESILFFSDSSWFRPLYIFSGLWSGIGMGTIIYLAAIAGVSQEQYEAAYIDGANRFQRIRCITIPAMLPTIVLLFILSIPGVIGSDTEKILLMYSSATYETADTIGTYVFRMGIENANYTQTSAIGLMLSLTSFSLLFIANTISRKFSEYSMW